MCLFRLVWASFLILIVVINLVDSLTHEYMVARQRRLLGEFKAPEPKNTSQQCLDDFQELLNDTARLINALDAAGKVSSGFLYANWAWLGNFDQCRSIDSMQYCLTVMKTAVNLTVAGISISNKPNGNVVLRWGVCVVDSCSDTDVANNLNDIINAAGLGNVLHIQEATVLCAQDPPIPYTIGYYVVVTVCCLFGVLVLGGLVLVLLENKVKKQTVERNIQQPILDESTALLGQSTGHQHLYNGQIQPDGQVIIITPPLANKVMASLKEFLKCFALNENISKLMNTKQSQKAIKCLHGLRVISMFWVILGHTFLWFILTGAVDNTPTVAKWLNLFSFQAISNATFSVDTFFFLSGLLVAYLAYFEIDKRNGKLPWFKFYFHRYWRLTPIYMFVIVLSIYLVPYMGQGPMWQPKAASLNCQSNWWTNMLYINNFYPTQTQKTMCIAWSWYLANDFQFYIISPLILLITFKSAIAGVAVTGAMLIGSFIITGTLYGVFGFKANMMNNDAGTPLGNEESVNSFDAVYVKPYCRIAPYLVGMVLGYFLYKYNNIKIKHSPIIALIGWLLAAMLAVTILYGLYPSTQGHVMSTFENVLYGTFSRFAWSIVLAWVVFACKFGMGGYVNNFLSWDFWVPLSRLTYLGYLLHPIILDILVFSYATPFHYSFNIISFHFAGVLVMSFSSAAILYLLVEFPLTNLGKLFEDLFTKKES